MKTILIERVANGWIVRPFLPSEGWVSQDRQEMYVYLKVEDLQRDLPKLIADEAAR